MLRFRTILSFLLLVALLGSACQPIVAPTASPPHYAHPEALVSTEWLAAHLADPTLRIVDGRAPAFDGTTSTQEEYATGHIPGAVYVDVWADISDPKGAVPALILPPADFEALMGRLGIDNATTVVLYDDAGNGWMARLWWALRYYGHDDVKLLNGGLTKWTLEGRPLETGTNTPSPTTFTANVRPDLLATRADVEQAIADPDIVLIDALPAPYYLGLQSDPGLRPGHIPTALNLPGPDNLDPVDSTVLSPAELTQRWQPLGLQPNQRIITYCGGGYIGAFDLFLLYQLGYEQISLYDGSLMEWATNPDLPMEMPLTPADLANVAVATDAADAFINSGVDATLQYYADDATFQTVMFGETTTYRGKAEIRNLMQSLVEQNFKLVLEPQKVEGDTITFKALSWSDDMNALGVTPLLATQVDVIRGGKVQSIVWTLSILSEAKIQRASAAAPAVAPLSSAWVLRPV